MRFFRLFGSFLILGVMVALSAGCGQKGPLYLSDNPPPGSKPPPSKAYKPVPYPEQKPEAEK